MLGWSVILSTQFQGKPPGGSLPVTALFESVKEEELQSKFFHDQISQKNLLIYVFRVLFHILLLVIYMVSLRGVFFLLVLEIGCIVLLGHFLGLPYNYLSHIMRKPAFCICEKQSQDQMRGNRTADQCLCFHYIQ